ncbi:MAG TPA: DUF4157 domain-containing protein [Longimicrobium sp.]|nr:DUF4157 domain-containing protein [Longimicrobium sp.]
MAHSAVAGRSRRNTTGAVVGPVAHDVLRRSGQPLDGPTRGMMEARFGYDFSRVRIHSDREAARAADSLGARAYTAGRDIVFGRNQYAPGSREGTTLLAHELTHVVQHDRSPIDTGAVEPVGSPAEREAHAVAAAVAGGDGPVRVTAASRGINRDVGWAGRGPIPDPYGVGYNTILTSAGAGAEPAVRDLASLEKADLTPDVAVFWALPAPRAQAVLALEPHAKGTTCASWFPTLHTLPSGPMALADPYDPIGAPRPVKAHFVQGRTNRKALVLGGVHNKSEPQGSVVVNRLLQILATRKTPPFFSVALVPDLFDPSRYGTNPRWIKGGMGQDTKGQLEKKREVEPNRNFPLPGEDLGAARARGAGSKTAPELVFNDPASASPRAAQDKKGAGAGTSIRMLPETRALIALVEHFQPERIASVHAHSLKSIPGDAPGIFVDPRGVDPVTGAVTNQGQADEDDRLAAAMVKQGRSRFAPGSRKPSEDPFVGNAAGLPTSTVRYTSGAHAEGNSLGTWAPVPVASGAGARPGITTMTIEVPQWGADTAGTPLDRVETLHSELLAEIFLEDPNVVTPATGPTKP